MTMKSYSQNSQNIENNMRHLEIPAEVLSFGEFSAQQITAAGGKGGALARLFQSGYPVPDGLVLLPNAFDGDVLKPEAWEQVESQLTRLRGSSGSLSFAIRSSALSEDSAQASFAGEFETVLEVRRDVDIQAAIQTVRQSQHSARVQAYSQAKAMDQEHQVAVIVQQMVPAKYAGILFTADPITGSRTQMAGNFVRGLGNQLVSGETSGESFTFERPRGRYQGPSDLKPYARKLHKLAERLETELGQPQDIEWAIADRKLYLLQSRPITTLVGYNPRSGEWNASLTGDYLWSNVNVGEAMSDVMTPLTWSLLKTIFSEMAIVPGYEIYGNIGGRPYNNVSVMATLLQALGRNLDNLNQEFGGGDRMPSWITIPKLPIRKSQIPAILKNAVSMQMKQIRAMKMIDQFIASNPAWTRKILSAIDNANTNDELIDLWWGEIDTYGRKHFWGLIAITYRYGELAGKLRKDLRQLVGIEDAEILLSNVSDDGELLASLGPVVGIWKISRGEMTRAEFLDQYGHRGSHEMEYSYPRPSEDPNWLVSQLAAFQKSPVDVDALLDAQKTRFDEAWERFQVQYPRKAKSIRRRLENVSAAARLREKVRAEITRLAQVSRACALRAGYLTRLGEDIFYLSFEEVRDLLSGQEVDAIQFIPTRKETFKRYKKLPAYPAAIRGRFDPFEWAADAERRVDYFDSTAPLHEDLIRMDSADTIMGSPGSSGRVAGIVRRLDSPEQGDQLQKGEILVTTQTNIGWTLLFPRAAAIITDVGAPLSHAAIVARELGIPAVVGAGNATKRLNTGDLVRVDGGRGIVEIIEKWQ